MDDHFGNTSKADVEDDVGQDSSDSWSAFLAQPMAYSRAPDANAKRWPKTETTWGAFAASMSKEAPAQVITQGPHVGDAPSKKNILRCHFFAHVVENGTTMASVEAKCRANGWAAFLYPIDGAPGETLIQEDVFERFNKRLRLDNTAAVQRYLTDVLGFRPEVVASATHNGRRMDRGLHVVVAHAPIERFVVMRPLSSPYEFVTSRWSQSERIATWAGLSAMSARELDVPSDKRTCDTAWCFPAPRALEGGTHRLVRGAPVDMEAMVTRLEGERAQETEAEQTKSKRTKPNASHNGDFKTPGLKTFLATHAQDFEAKDWFEAVASEDVRNDCGGKADCCCPTEDLHSEYKADDKAFCVWNASERDGGGFYMLCMHATCKEASRDDRAFYLDAACVKYGVKHADELLEFCPNAGEAKEEGNPRPSGKAHEGGPGWVKRMIVPPETLVVLDDMNKHHAFVVYGGKTRFLSVTENPEKFELPYQFLDSQTFGHLLEDTTDVKLIQRKLRNGGDPNNADDWEEISVWKPRAWVWNNWPGRRKYTRIGFYPNKDAPDGAFNFWEGWRHAPKKGSWKWTLKHIYEVICCRDAEKFRWLIDHMSHVLQTTGQAENRSPVSPFIWGEHGSGKSIVFDHIAKMFGNHGITLSKSEELTGTFNKHLMLALYVVCEEAVYGKDLKAAAAVKDLHTRRTVNVHPKGIDMFTAPNFLRFVYIGNRPDQVPMSLTERRFEVFHASPHRINDDVWFDRILVELREGGLEAMMHDLMTRKFDERAVRHLMKDNEDRDASKARTFEPPARFALEWIAHGAVMLRNTSPLASACKASPKDATAKGATLSEMANGNASTGDEASTGGGRYLKLEDRINRAAATDVKTAYDEWCEMHLDQFARRTCQRAPNQLTKEIREALPFIKPYRNNAERGVELPSWEECSKEAQKLPIAWAYIKSVGGDED